MEPKNTNKIYLDYAASTPVHPQVVEAMIPYFSDTFGNSTSVHTFGQRSEAAVETAREKIANILNCKPSEIIFTACGTESDNLALRGAALHAKETRGADHILVSPVEHKAVSETAEQLAEHFGFTLEYLPVDEFGIVSPVDLKNMIQTETAVVSVIYGNNEIGTLNPIAELGEICQAKGIPFHTDAVQAAAHLPIDLQKLNVDLMAIGAHKFYGPKGVGVLYVREGIPLLTTITGGGHENQLRSGTLNVPYIVGMADAFELTQIENEMLHGQIVGLRDKIIQTVLDEIPDAKLTGHPTERLANNASFVFRGVDGNNLLMMLDGEGFAVSSGSACKTGNPEPSDALLALGLEPEWALGSLRVSLGRQTSEENINQFLAILPKLIKRNRAMGTM